MSTDKAKSDLSLNSLQKSIPGRLKHTDRNKYLYLFHGLHKHTLCSLRCPLGNSENLSPARYHCYLHHNLCYLIGGWDPQRIPKKFWPIKSLSYSIGLFFAKCNWSKSVIMCPICLSSEPVPVHPTQVNPRGACSRKGLWWCMRRGQMGFAASHSLIILRKCHCLASPSPLTHVWGAKKPLKQRNSPSWPHRSFKGCVKKSNATWITSKSHRHSLC